MGNIRKILSEILLSVFILSAFSANSQNMHGDMSRKRIPLNRPDAADTSYAAIMDSVYSGIKRIYHYEWSASPFFSSEKGFGAGAYLKISYNSDKSRQFDSIQQLSFIGLDLNASLRGYVSGGILGTHLRRKGITEYHASASYGPEYARYVGKSDTGTEISFRNTTITAGISHLFGREERFYAGPAFEAEYVLPDIAGTGNLPASFSLKHLRLSAGVTFLIDKKINKANPSEGYYLSFSPAFNSYCSYDNAGNLAGTNRRWRYGFGMEMCFDFYLRLWKSAVLATDLYCNMRSGEIPESLYLKAGDDRRLRGYMPGLYRYCSIAAAQTELRQKIYRRHSISAWASVGAGMGKKAEICGILPSAGAGYRFSFTDGLLIRVDFGFGKSGAKALIIGINEAF